MDWTTRSDAGPTTAARPRDRTVGAALQTAAERLRAAGLEAPRSEALALLAVASGRPKVHLVAFPAEELAADLLARFWTMVERRAAREPFAYVVGEREFFGRPFQVDRRVLTPRPETELLVEQALALCDRLAARGIAAPLVVDVGTGSGAIAVSLALERPQARLIATDRSADALAVAAANARRLGAHGVRFVRGDLLEPFRGRFHLVLANLPYVPADEIEALMPEVCRYEPRVALDGGADGVGLIARLVAALPERLAPRGAALLEIGHGQGRAVSALARAALPAARVAVLPDLAGLERVVRITQPELDA